jgi:hypothetical protein
MNCECMKWAKPNTCEACRFGFCPRCTYPQEIECRRRAPIRDEARGNAVWPMVSRDAWCGDFEARSPGEEKP